MANTNKEFNQVAEQLRAKTQATKAASTPAADTATLEPTNAKVDVNTSTTSATDVADTKVEAATTTVEKPKKEKAVSYEDLTDEQLEALLTKRGKKAVSAQEETETERKAREDKEHKQFLQYAIDKGLQPEDLAKPTLYKQTADKELVWKDYQAKNPDVDEAILRAEFEYDFRLDAQWDDTESQKFGAQKLKARAEALRTKAENTINPLRKQFELDRTAQAQFAQIETKVDNYLKQYPSTLDIEFDGHPVPVEIDPIGNDFKQILLKSTWLASQDNSGELDVAAIAKEKIIAANLPKILGAVVAKAIADERKESNKPFINPMMSSTSTAGVGGDEAEKRAAKLKAAVDNFGSKRGSLNTLNK